MMKIFCANVLVIFLYMFLSSDAYAGAWPLPTGEGQIITTTVYDTAASEFDENGNEVSGTDFSKLDSLIFFEHGLTPKLTLVSAISFQDVNYVGRNGRDNYQGFGDTQLGLRYNVLKTDRWVLSGQVLGVIGGGGETLPDADLGNGGNGFDARALLGRSYELAGHKGFAEIQTAWRYRSGNIPDTWQIDGTVGIEATKRLKVIGQGFYASTDSALLEIDRIRGNKSLKLSASAVYQWKEKRSLQFGVFQTVSGENIVKEQAVFASVWQRY